MVHSLLAGWSRFYLSYCFVGQPFMSRVEHRALLLLPLPLPVPLLLQFRLLLLFQFLCTNELLWPRHTPSHCSPEIIKWLGMNDLMTLPQTYVIAALSEVKGSLWIAKGLSDTIMCQGQCKFQFQFQFHFNLPFDYSICL